MEIQCNFDHFNSAKREMGNDDSISEDEFIAVAATKGIDKPNAQGAFQAMDSDGR